MPLDKSLHKVMVIGSGPIVIGQAAEFDYSGTQACRVLREDNIEIVLVNSNPATIMTDPGIADKIYLEPLTEKTLERIIEKERPDAILSGFGGQNGLNLSMKLAKAGVLDRYHVRLLGADPVAIDRAEDRLKFKEMMDLLDQPSTRSEIVTEIEAAVGAAEEIGYPVIVRPAFTLGGSGGGIADNETQLREIVHQGLDLSPIHQCLIEQSIAGWKEIEFEVIRDGDGNALTVCSMENFDPVGVHTGDSIVVAPAVTLADKEYQMLRSAALKIIEELKLEGGCNIQFALHPESFEYAVIEVNPRVSRSSALASKATGYPIARVSAKIALGYRLNEITNEVTGNTTAAFEPAIDYLAVKFPKWPFDKFVYAERRLGTQMKATGEVMAISDRFSSGIIKAVQGAEIGCDTLNLPKYADSTREELLEVIARQTDERIFAVFSALKAGVSVEELHHLTMIDEWFLYELLDLADYEKRLATEGLTEKLYYEGKSFNYLDSTLMRLSGQSLPVAPHKPVYKMVDTCAGEFAAKTPYFYSLYPPEASGGENEALPFIEQSAKQTIVVFGSGPIRIGQGIEFDYASVHAVRALQQMGFEVVTINNNPETVSTDYDSSDRLYFEPLVAESVLHILEIEKPLGCIVSFGGQTSIKLTKAVSEAGYTIFGSSAKAIDMAENREEFDDLLTRLDIARPRGHAIRNVEEAIETANELGFPVLMRPSFVLGGQNMIIAHNEDDIREYLKVILEINPDNIVLLDKYLMGREVEVDGIYDGEDLLLPGIMEHVERAGVHSGDSIAVYPALNVSEEMRRQILQTTRRLCQGLDVRGIVNLQYIIQDEKLYVIEVNPRASRTVPYLSKVTGIPIVDLATEVCMGRKLRDLGYGTGLHPDQDFYAVKVPVFSFAKLTGTDTQLGPEMKSTGEVLGIGRTMQEALYKGLLAAGFSMKKSGGIFFTVRNWDKPELAPVAQKFANLGFQLYATEGTAELLEENFLWVTHVGKIHEGRKNGLDLMEEKRVQYVVSTSTHGRNPEKDGVKIRLKATQLGIPCLSSIDTANALADALQSGFSEENTELIDIVNLGEEIRRIR